MHQIRFALSQMNPILGDFSGNSDKIVADTKRAIAQGADIVAFPEMALSGYPIEDLATRKGFLIEATNAVVALASRLNAEGLGQVPVIVGYPDGAEEQPEADTIATPSAIARNRAAVLFDGRILGNATKHHLPNYSVFDEFRNFIPGNKLTTVALRDADVAILICEDIWQDGGPMAKVADSGASALLVINGSPYEYNKDETRLPLVRKRAQETGVPVAYVNMTGGQDDLVFDGDSIVVTADSDVLARGPQFEDALLVVDVPVLPRADKPTPPAELNRLVVPYYTDAEPKSPIDAAEYPRLDDLAELWQALVVGLRDYVDKNGFPSVILGLSGGIDSSVVAAIAVDALGADRVYGVSMPSRYSSAGSVSDADLLVAATGVHYQTEPIKDLVLPFEEQLSLSGVAAENLQARVRGVILMGLSNARGHLVLTTGNKSELAVGYSTIYGDSVGGFNPIKDVLKTFVWELAKWRNAHALANGQQPPIPENAIIKPPSAELRPDQTDQDSLPPYSVLDGILHLYIEERLSRNEVVEHGYDAEIVDHILTLTDRAEWKRRQSAIGTKVTGLAFGRDRRLPITVRASK